MDAQNALTELYDSIVVSSTDKQPPDSSKFKTGDKRPANPSNRGLQNKRFRTNRGGRGRGRGNYHLSQPSTSDTRPTPHVRQTYQRQRFYQILCANRGIRLICDVLFDSLRFRDFRMATNVTKPQLIYCVAVSLLARCAQVAIELGYCPDVQELSQLIRSVKGLQLPTVLARYIECVGKVQLAAGPWVGPWFDTRERMFARRLEQVDLDEILREGDRPIPDNYWSIDRAWIQEWNQATTRPSRLGMQFRAINWSELNGTVEMFVTPMVDEQDEEDPLFRPTAPQTVSDVEAQLGAVYRWRDFSTLRHWPSNTALVCTKLTYGTELYPKQHWGDIITKSFIQ